MASDGKSAVGSLGIWGSIVALGGGLLEVVGEVVKDPVLGGYVPPSWNPYIVMVGAVVALAGRIRATEPITSILPPK